MQKQAIQAAQVGSDTAQSLAKMIRNVGVVVSHVTATGLADKLPTIVQEFATFAAWDQTGDPIAESKPNPKYQPETISERRIKTVDGVPEIIDGEQQYEFVTIANPKHNTNIKPYLFNSSTGVEVDSNGNVQGTEISVESLLTLLQVAGALDAFVKSTPDGFAGTVQQTLESVVTL
jgi:hypothetical protein